jgi:hypothetical protein
MFMKALYLVAERYFFILFSKFSEKTLSVLKKAQQEEPLWSVRPRFEPKLAPAGYQLTIN